MSDIQIASYSTELEIRESADGGDGFTVVGRLVPFNTVTHGAGRTSAGATAPYSETFLRGAFSKTIQESASKVVLRPFHGAQPVGKAIALEEREDGLWATFRVSDVQAGREMLTLMRDHVTSELSIEFIPVRSAKNSNGVMERSEVILRGVAATSHPAYQGATVTNIRDFNIDDPECAPRLLRAQRELQALKALSF
jgi:HK97 family phage prohead protease